MPTTTPLPIRLTQTLGLTTSLLLAGSTLSTSLTTVPRLLESPPSLLIQQWGHMYDTGKKTGPPLAILSSSTFFYLAYSAHVHTSRSLSGAIVDGMNVAATSAPSRVWAYMLAGVLSVGIIPYTFAVLMPTNRRLLEKVEVLGKLGSGELEAEVEENAHQLVDWWGVLNLGRGVMLVGSGVLGVWASLG